MPAEENERRELDLHKVFVDEYIDLDTILGWEDTIEQELKNLGIIQRGVITKNCFFL